MGKLTAKAIEKAVPREKEYKLNDGNGLYIRVRPSGVKSYLYSYRLPGNRSICRMTIASIDEISLKKVRETVTELRRLVAQGLDPRNVRAASKTENAQAITMQALFDAWLDFVRLTGDVAPSWSKKQENRWKLHLKKSLGDILVKDITRAHLAATLETMARRGAREETRKALTTLNLMLDYALKRHFIEVNPARILKPKDFSATANRPRDRVLTLTELRKLWLTLDHGIEMREGIASSATISLVTVTAIKLLILTGARRKEMAALSWQELDLDKGIWNLHFSRTKNKQSHTIYLSKIAIELLSDLKRITGHSEFVFDTSRDTQRCHIHEDSLTSALARLRKTTLLSELEPFTIHDLRRSAATAWGEYLKTPPHIIEHMLNHQPRNKLIATYQQAVHAQEQKQTWLAWGEIVERQIARDPGNVVPIKSAAIA